MYYLNRHTHTKYTSKNTFIQRLYKSKKVVFIFNACYRCNKFNFYKANLYMQRDIFSAYPHNFFMLSHFRKRAIIISQSTENSK